MSFLDKFKKSINTASQATNAHNNEKSTEQSAKKQEKLNTSTGFFDKAKSWGNSLKNSDNLTVNSFGSLTLDENSNTSIVQPDNKEKKCSIYVNCDGAFKLKCILESNVDTIKHTFENSQTKAKTEFLSVVSNIYETAKQKLDEDIANKACIELKTAENIKKKALSDAVAAKQMAIKNLVPIEPGIPCSIGDNNHRKAGQIVQVNMISKTVGVSSEGKIKTLSIRDICVGNNNVSHKNDAHVGRDSYINCGEEICNLTGGAAKKQEPKKRKNNDGKAGGSTIESDSQYGICE